MAERTHADKPQRIAAVAASFAAAVAVVVVAAADTAPVAAVCKCLDNKYWTSAAVAVGP